MGLQNPSSSRSSSLSSSRPARLIDIFSTPSPLPRTSVDYSVYSVPSFPSSSSIAPPLDSPGVHSLSSSLSSAMSSLLPTPPHLARSSSIPSKRAPSNPPSAYQPQQQPTPPTRSERLLLATLARAEAAQIAHASRTRAAHSRSHSYSPPSTPPYPSPRSSPSTTDEPDWLAEIAEQSCMRPSHRSPADPGRMGRTTSAVHVSRSPSPGKMARISREREKQRRRSLQVERDHHGEGATFGPLPIPIALPSTESMGFFLRSETSSTASPSRRPELHLSTTPSPAGESSTKHTDWPWEPTSPTLRTAPPTTGSTTDAIVKPHLSRAQTSPAATLRRSSTTGGTRPPVRHWASGGSSKSRSTPPAEVPPRPQSSASGFITPPPSPPFDAQSTSLLLKHREGYVSFRELEGLGSPDEEDEDEGRGEGESDGSKRRRTRWWGLGSWVAAR